MRSRFAILLAVAAVCVTAAWAEWTPEVLVTDGGSSSRTLYFNNSRKLVFAPDGVGHVIWHGDGRIGCNRYDPLSGWDTDYQVNLTGNYPAVALDADGTTIHVVWQDTYLFYRKCTRGQGGGDEWGAVESPYNAHAVSVPGPAVACVPGDPNHVVVCWGEEFSTGGKKPKTARAIGFTECIDGTWGTPIRLDSNTTYGRSFPSIAVAPNGDVFIAYWSNDDNSSSEWLTKQVYVKTRHNGVWGATVDVTLPWAAERSTMPAIEVNPYTGNPHVVFDWSKVVKVSKKVSYMISGVLHTYRNSQGAWLTTPDTVSVLQQTEVGNRWQFPTIAFASDGAAHAGWCLDKTYFPQRGTGVMYSYCSVEGSTWSDPVWLTSDTLGYYDDGFPYAAVDEAASTIHVVWCRHIPGHGDPSQIWWRSNYLGGDGGQAQPVALSQSGVELVPNPARAGRVTVRCALPHAGPVTVTLVDVSGRVVKTQEVAAGRRGTVGIDVSGLNAGVYVARLVAGDLTVSKSLVIER